MYEMAYRRRQGITRASTFKEDIYSPPTPSYLNGGGGASSLAAQAIRASAAHRDSSLSSAYGDSAFHSSSIDRSKFYQSYHPAENSRKMDNPRLRKGLDALTSSLNHIGDTIGNALEEGRTIVESKTADIIQETRRLQSRRRGANFEEQNQASGLQSALQQSAAPHMQTSQEDKLKASRDVAMATAAKAKLLLRELKTVKADLAFAKQRCSQLEEENRILRESRDKGDNPADDDMIRLQLETLLAEKARLAHENSVYARENRFLREIVEYHQLTMQDVVYLDEGIEEFTEVYPIPAVSRMLSASPPSPISPNSPPENLLYGNSSISKLSLDGPLMRNTSDVDAPTSCSSTVSTAEESTRQ